MALRPNSLAAYRRDLRRYAEYLRRRGVTGDVAARVDERIVAGYVEELQQARTDDGLRRVQGVVDRARARRGALVPPVLRRGGAARLDPSDDVGAPRVPQGIPKALTEAEVEALLGAVPGDGPRPERDRAILELLYAGGLRISELVGPRPRRRRPLRRPGARARQGIKERVVPLGRSAARRVGDYLTTGRPELAGRRTTDVRRCS